MLRKAVIVAGAAGSDEAVGAVLPRYAFAPAVTAPTLAQALVRVRAEQVDLLIVPLQASGNDIAALEREIPRLPGTFVIGTSPDADPSLILRAMRAGVHEFLVYPPTADDLAAAVDRMVRRSQPATGKRATFAVYSAKGGVGTTSVALNLAYALGRNEPGANVVLADFVVSGGDVAVMLDQRPSYDVGDLALKLGQVDGALLDSLLARTKSGVSVLPASERIETLELVDGNAATAIIKALRAHFTYTVVDCEHHPTDRTLTAFDAADRIVVVTQLNVAAVRSAQRTLALFRRLGYDDDKIVVVANRAQPSDLISADDAARVLERELFWRLPNDYRASEAALTRGVPVLESDPASALARAYLTLAAKLGVGDDADAPRPPERSAPGSRLRSDLQPRKK
jgi:pilus assembly protein CpaE